MIEGNQTCRSCLEDTSPALGWLRLQNCRRSDGIHGAVEPGSYLCGKIQGVSAVQYLEDLDVEGHIIVIGDEVKKAFGKKALMTSPRKLEGDANVTA